MTIDPQLNSTEKVIWLLKRLGEPPYEMGLTELAKEIDYAKSGLHKILSSLIVAGFVCQHYQTKKYCLGPTVHRLGMAYNEQKVMWNYAGPTMEEVNRITQESVYICIRQGDTAVVAFSVETRNALRLDTKLGKLCPINAGSMGKLMAAFHDRQRIQTLLTTTPLVKRTPNTIIDPQKLLLAYDQICSQGYALSSEENCLGAFGIAAPIRNKSGRVFAGLSISGPKIRFSPEKVAEWTDIVVHGAKAISACFGYDHGETTQPKRLMVSR